MIIKQRIVAGILACMGVGMVAQAGVVVDLNFVSTSNNVAPRSPDINTATHRQYNFSNSSVLFDGSTSLGQKIYGGFQATNVVSASTSAFVIDNTSGFLALTSPFTTIQNKNGVMLWKSADFVSGNNAFDGSAGSSFSISTGGTKQGNQAIAFILRDSGTYYISNQQNVNIGANASLTFNGESAGQQWSVFDMDKWTAMRAGAAGDWNQTFSYGNMTFGNVEEVGFVFAGYRTAVTGNNTLQVADFQVALIPEPGTLGIITASGLGILFIRRRLSL